MFNFYLFYTWIPLNLYSRTGRTYSYSPVGWRVGVIGSHEVVGPFDSKKLCGQTTSIQAVFCSTYRTAGIICEAQFLRTIKIAF